MKITSKPNSTTKNKTGGWRTFVPETNSSKCIACGLCAKVCPEGIIKKTSKNGKDYYKADLEYCKGCGLCAEECPAKAIEMKLEEK